VYPAAQLANSFFAGKQGLRRKTPGNQNYFGL
jgi:hypothetical protein